VLGGTGTIGSVTVETGGIHAPGNSIGTQTIAGDYVNHGTLQVEGNPTSTDQLIVTGNVDISGATLDLLLTPATADGWSAVNGPFTLISKESAGAVTGTFATVNNNLLFLNHSLDYAGGDGNDVTLKLTRNSISFADIGQTPNQIAAAKALDGLSVTNPLWNAISTMSSEDEARRAFDQASGEVHASASSALIESSSHIRAAANDRLRAAFEGVGSALMPVMAYGPDGAGIAPASSSEGLAVWSQVFGSWGRFDGDGNAAGLDASTGGLLFGGDAMLGTWRVGLLGGYSYTSLHADPRNSSA
jgi:outer membrane autotransporter protein